MSFYGMALAQSEDTIVYGVAFLCVFRVMMCLFTEWLLLRVKTPLFMEWLLCVFRVMMCLLMERLLFRVKMPFCMKWLFL